MEQQNDRSLYRGIRLLAGLLWLMTPIFVRADTTGDSQTQTSSILERRITLTRSGYGQARPDWATIELPFAVQGENGVAVEKQRDLLLASLQAEIAPAGSPANTVYINQAQSGQLIQEGKTIMTYTGTVCVSVRDLSHWKALLLVLIKKSSTPLTLNYHVTETTALLSAKEQAQKNAILQARKDADRLAGIAGTRVIGVQQIREGGVQNVPPASYTFQKSSENPIPQEIPAIGAEITITYELAPPTTGQPAVKTKPQKNKKPNH